MEVDGTHRKVNGGLFLTPPFKAGVDIVKTTGYNLGYISLSPTNKILIANDSIAVENNEVEKANPQFALDLNQAL